MINGLATLTKVRLRSRTYPMVSLENIDADEATERASADGLFPPLLRMVLKHHYAAILDLPCPLVRKESEERLLATRGPEMDAATRATEEAKAAALRKPGPRGGATFLWRLPDWLQSTSPRMDVEHVDIAAAIVNVAHHLRCEGAPEELLPREVLHEAASDFRREFATRMEKHFRAMAEQSVLAAVEARLGAKARKRLQGVLRPKRVNDAAILSEYEALEARGHSGGQDGGAVRIMTDRINTDEREYLQKRGLWPIDAGGVWQRIRRARKNL